MHGATTDRTLPEPHVSPDADNWELAEESEDVHDLEQGTYCDGVWKGNSSKFESVAPLAQVLALEPDDGVGVDEVQGADDDHPEDFEVVNPDMKASRSAPRWPLR